VRICVEIYTQALFYWWIRSIDYSVVWLTVLVHHVLAYIAITQSGCWLT